MLLIGIVSHYRVLCAAGGLSTAYDCPYVPYCTSTSHTVRSITPLDEFWARIPTTPFAEFPNISWSYVIKSHLLHLKTFSLLYFILAFLSVVLFFILTSSILSLKNQLDSALTKAVF
jgi:hypothetical protein